MIDKELFKLIGEDKRDIFAVVGHTVSALFCRLIYIGCLCRIIAALAEGQQVSSAGLAQIFALALLFVVLQAIISRHGASIRDGLGAKVKKNLRSQVYDKILRLGERSTADGNMAGLTQIALEGVEQLDLYFTSYMPQFFYAMLAPVILFFVCVWIDWHTAVILLACVPLIPASIIAMSRYAKKVFAKYWGKYISMGDGFLDAVSGLKDLKIFQDDERYGIKMNEKAEEFRKITMKVLVMQLGSTTVMDLIAYGGAGLGIAMTVRDLYRGYIGIGAGLFLILVAVEFFLPMRAFGSAFHVAMNGASAGKKIIALLGEAEPTWGQGSVSGCDIELQDVSFSYDGKRQVLGGVDMAFPEKGMYAIVGESGCGKSTIVKLLLGGRSHGGDILIGGQAIEQLSRESYFAHVGTVSYNTYIFNDTVRGNFLLVNPGLSEEAMWQALEQVNLASFLRANGGLGLEIKEDGTNISGGQKQRLALAIHLAAGKDAYIFDEATSNIDAESEAIIMDTIAELAKSRLAVVISHRLANVVDADCIYYLEGGRVAESGSHVELLERNGGYAALYLRQCQLEQGETAEMELSEAALLEDDVAVSAREEV